MNNETDIVATQMFVISRTPREIAEYIVNMQSSLDGMLALLAQYRNAYAELWHTKNPTNNDVHPSATVSGDAEIGDGVSRRLERR